MTQRNTRPAHKQDDDWQAAAAYGCDMALLDRNLRMTPSARVEAHAQALALVKALRQAKNRRHA